MSHCLWCDEEIIHVVSWREVFGIPHSQVLCGACFDGLERLSGTLCRICGRSFEELDPSFQKEDLCYDCLRWEESEWRGVLIKNRSLFHYNEFLKDTIARFKFRGDVVMAKGFQTAFTDLYCNEFSGKIVVPIPLSAERLYERGFNQALELARLLPAAVCEALERTGNKTKQSKKTRAERIQYDTPIFQCNHLMTDIEGKNVVIVDDIYTTGATVRHAANALLDGGAASVCSITVARG